MGVFKQVEPTRNEPHGCRWLQAAGGSHQARLGLDEERVSAVIELVR